MRPQPELKHGKAANVVSAQGQSRQREGNLRASTRCSTAHTHHALVPRVTVTTRLSAARGGRLLTLILTAELAPPVYFFASLKLAYNTPI